MIDGCFIFQNKREATKKALSDKDKQIETISNIIAFKYRNLYTVG